MNLWTKPAALLASLLPMALLCPAPASDDNVHRVIFDFAPPELVILPPDVQRARPPAFSRDPDYLHTNSAEDLSLTGPGYFVLRDPTFGDLLLQRSVILRPDEQGVRLTFDGLRLQYWRADGLGLADLQRSPDSDPWRAFVFEANGRILEPMPDGSLVFRGTLACWLPAQEPLSRQNDETFYDPSLDLAADSPSDPRFQPSGMEVVTGWYQRTPASLLVRPPTPGLPTLQPSPRVRLAVSSMLMLDGPGFWSVRDPHTHRKYLTRRSAFRVDADRYMVTASGSYRLQRRDADGRVSDFQLPTPSRPVDPPVGRFCSSYSFSPDGVIRLHFSDGEEATLGTLEVVRILDQRRLQSAGEGYWVDDETLPRHPAPLDPDLPREQRIRVLWGAADLRELDEVERTSIETEYRHAQQVVQRTGRALDFAITGPGFFLVRAPGAPVPELTRDGHFHRSVEGFLETAYGERVQGVLPGKEGLSDVPLEPFAEDSAEARPFFPGLTTDPEPLPSYNVDFSGNLLHHREDGSIHAVAELAFGFPPDLMKLKETRRLRYAVVDESGRYVLPPWISSSPLDGNIRVLNRALEIVEAPTLFRRIPKWATQIEVLGTTARPLEIAVSDDGVQWRPWLSRGPEGAWTIAPGAESTTVRVSEWYPVFFDLTQPQAGSRLYRLTPQPWQY